MRGESRAARRYFAGEGGAADFLYGTALHQLHWSQLAADGTGEEEFSAAAGTEATFEDFQLETVGGGEEVAEDWKPGAFQRVHLWNEI